MNLPGLYSRLGRLIERRRTIKEEIQILKMKTGETTEDRCERARRLEKDSQIVQREILEVDGWIDDIEKATLKNYNKREN